MEQRSSSSSFLSRLIFRTVQPTDIPRCHAIESTSYPPDEAASKSNLQYRQHHAASYFRCAFLLDEPPPDTTHMSMTGCIIGYICSTRCDEFTKSSLTHHDSNGRYLAIHSVAVDEAYRNCGVGTAMLQDYCRAMERINVDHRPMEKMVGMAKKDLLAFYVRNGFAVTNVSPIVHGAEEWFDMERPFPITTPPSPTTTIPCYILDAFVDPMKPRCSGNPASVVVLTGPPGGREMVPVESWMSAVAKELHQSETAFVWRIGAERSDVTIGTERSDVTIVQSERPSIGTERSDVTIQQSLQQASFESSQATFHLKPSSHQPSSHQPSSHQPSSHQPSSSPLTYAIRYYSRSGVEVDLCGHATLASASVLLNQQTNGVVTFVAKHHVLSAELRTTESDTNMRIELNFPWNTVTPLPSSQRDVVLDVISRAFVGTTGGATPNLGMTHPEESSVAAKFKQFFHKDPDLTPHILYMGLTEGREDLFLEVTEEGFHQLRECHVNYSALRDWTGYSRGVILCCGSSSTTDPSLTQPIDFRSRFFGPKIGIDEDPVTGSAHCSLGPYFGAKFNKLVLVGKQESERGGLVECILKPEERRVGIIGTTSKTMYGNLSIPI